MSRLILMVPLLLSFSSRDAPGCGETSLHRNADFRIGAALNTEKLKFEEKYWTVALEHFNSFTPEKIMKPRYLQPQQNAFDFSELDHLMPFCRDKNIRIHGHTLVWHKELPAWMEKFGGDQAAWDTLLKKHIHTIIWHCRDNIKSWDVVNEALNDDGTLRNNIWLQKLGESYIEKAFRYAWEADTSALLFYNDYGLEENGPKLTAALKLLNGLREKGVKVDGIGLQMHVNLEFPPVETVNKSAMAIQKNGYLVHYSELDVSQIEGQSIFSSKKKLMKLQATRMKEIVEGYMKLDSASRFGITLWGVSDNDSWLTEDRLRSRPMLFDQRYRIKPAFCGFVEGLGK